MKRIILVAVSFILLITAYLLLDTSLVVVLYYVSVGTLNGFRLSLIDYPAELLRGAPWMLASALLIVADVAYSAKRGK